MLDKDLCRVFQRYFFRGIYPLGMLSLFFISLLLGEKMKRNFHIQTYKPGKVLYLAPFLSGCIFFLYTEIFFPYKKI